MIDSRNLNEPNALGAGRTAPGEVSYRYQQPFQEFGAAALWSSQPVPNPTVADALAITQSLRVEGDRNGRQLTERIERACRSLNCKAKSFCCWPHRYPECYVADSTYLTRSGLRISSDIDIFHDREDRMAHAKDVLPPFDRDDIGQVGSRVS